MSHFAVLVIGADVAQQLAPFQENNMGDCPRQYLAFVDKEAELKEEYLTDTATRVVMEDGSYKTPYDDAFKQLQPGTTHVYTTVVPDHLEKREVPLRELYPTFEAFVEDGHGYSGRDKETQRYGYWENPNRKWDWYEVGGHWTGFFPLKQGAQGELGRPGLRTAQAAPGRADCCRLGDIDFASQRAKERNEAEQRYRAYASLIAQHGQPLEFADLKAAHPEDIAAARSAYWAQPAIQALQKADLMPWGGTLAEAYGMGEAAYVERAVNSVGVPFAVLKDGVWYEQGEMGWWGMASNPKDPDEWNRQFHALLDSLPPETRVTVIDCHI